VSPAIDPVSRERESYLNGLYAIGLIATLAFVTVTFAALVVVFVIRSSNEYNWTRILLPPVLWVDTLILIASTFTYEAGHRRLRLNDQTSFYRWMGWTTVLGVLFLVGQLAAWVQILANGQGLYSNPHSSFFFLFSGLHGAHILVGLAGLLVLLRRTREPASGPKWQMTTRVLANAVAIFWHYLDLLWIVLFVLLLFVRR
jgi:cytochrome c oxidase subunit 3